MPPRRGERDLSPLESRWHAPVFTSKADRIEPFTGVLISSRSWRFGSRRGAKMRAPLIQKSDPSGTRIRRACAMIAQADRMLWVPPGDFWFIACCVRELLGSETACARSASTSRAATSRPRGPMIWCCHRVQTRRQPLQAVALSTR
jgi:hypothetical protein